MKKYSPPFMVTACGDAVVVVIVEPPHCAGQWISGRGLGLWPITRSRPGLPAPAGTRGKPVCPCPLRKFELLYDVCIEGHEQQGDILARLVVDPAVIALSHESGWVRSKGMASLHRACRPRMSMRMGVTVQTDD